MKRYIIFLLLVLLGVCTLAQTTSFAVNGDGDKFYPVVFQDNNWYNNVPTEIEIGRSGVHGDSEWKGSLMARFRFHNTLWGNGARFTDVDIMQRENGYQASVYFIAGYRDATIYAGALSFIIWLKGNTTYHYRSNTTQSPAVYDEVQNPLPFQEQNGPAHTFKTTVDEYVNSAGKSVEGSIYLTGAGTNYMAGNLGLGTLTPKEKLAVNGNVSVNGKIGAKEVKVEAKDWPDYVFDKDYALPSLAETEKHIKEKGHLPGMPSAKEVEANGIELGDMNKRLLQKIEELTLYLIEKDKAITILQAKNARLENEQAEIKKEMKRLLSKTNFKN